MFTIVKTSTVGVVGNAYVGTSNFKSILGSLVEEHEVQIIWEVDYLHLSNKPPVKLKRGSLLSVDVDLSHFLHDGCSLFSE